MTYQPAVALDELNNLLDKWEDKLARFTARTKDTSDEISLQIELGRHNLDEIGQELHAWFAKKVTALSVRAHESSADIIEKTKKMLTEADDSLYPTIARLERMQQEIADLQKTLRAGASDILQRLAKACADFINRVFHGESLPHLLKSTPAHETQTHD